LVDQQKQVGNLGSDGRHVVGVEILLDDFGNGAVGVQQEVGSDQKDDVCGANGLLYNLEGNDGNSCCRIDTGTDHDETQSHTDDNVQDANNDIEENSDFEHEQGFRDFVHGLLGLLPFDKDPPDRDGSVDSTEDADDREDTSREGGSSKAFSALLQLLALVIEDGLGFRHLYELICVFGRHDTILFFVKLYLSWKKENYD